MSLPFLGAQFDTTKNTAFPAYCYSLLEIQGFGFSTFVAYVICYDSQLCKSAENAGQTFGYQL